MTRRRLQIGKVTYGRDDRQLSPPSFQIWHSTSSKLATLFISQQFIVHSTAGRMLYFGIRLRLQLYSMSIVYQVRAKK